MLSRGRVHSDVLRFRPSWLWPLTVSGAVLGLLVAACVVFWGVHGSFEVSWLLRLGPFLLGAGCPFLLLLTLFIILTVSVSFELSPEGISISRFGRIRRKVKGNDILSVIGELPGNRVLITTSEGITLDIWPLDRSRIEAVCGYMDRYFTDPQVSASSENPATGEDKEIFCAEVQSTAFWTSLIMVAGMFVVCIGLGVLEKALLGKDVAENLWEWTWRSGAFFAAFVMLIILVFRFMWAGNRYAIDDRGLHFYRGGVRKSLTPWNELVGVTNRRNSLTVVLRDGGRLQLGGLSSKQRKEFCRELGKRLPRRVVLFGKA